MQSEWRLGVCCDGCGLDVSPVNAVLVVCRRVAWGLLERERERDFELEVVLGCYWGPVEPLRARWRVLCLGCAEHVCGYDFCLGGERVATYRQALALCCELGREPWLAATDWWELLGRLFGLEGT